MQGFESFPQFIDESDLDANTTLTAKLKRWIVGSTSTNATSSSSSTTATAHPPVAASLTPATAATGTAGQGRPLPSGATVATSGSVQPDDGPKRSSRNHSRNSSLSIVDPRLLDSHSNAPIRPPPVPLIGGTRGPTELSSVGAPSVRVTVANADTLDLVRNANSSRWFTSQLQNQALDDLTAVGSSAEAPAFKSRRAPSIYGSPTMTTMSESFGATTLVNLSSIPGFPLARDLADDTKSVGSISTVARPSASVAHVIRKLRGEGLSKDYWIKDESSKECFDCQTVFTAFRRKHHCRICGQIFCSRCASNIISSARFGQQGYVRVCNLCLSVLEHGGDPTHRSAAPAAKSEQSPYLISAPLEASAKPPQSQFAASHLFPRSETPYYNPSGFDFGAGSRHSDTSSRPRTPFTDDDDEDRRRLDDIEDDDDDELEKSPKRLMSISPGVKRRKSSRAATVPSTAIAPFRRSLAEDDVTIPVPAEEVAPTIETPPTTDVAHSMLSGTSEPRSPVTAMAPLPRFDRPPPEEEVSPHADLEQSPLVDQTEIDVATSESSPRRSRHSSHRTVADSVAAVGVRDLPRLLATSALSFAPQDSISSSTDDVGLSDPVMWYTRKMLHQMLVRAKIPEPRTWERVLVPLLVQIAQHTVPDLSAGDHLDVRDYVRIKKVPGGRPRDSHYVDGVVFTKNVLHKKMARHLTNPRVMLFSFPLEYQRIENQLVSIDPLIHQEKEYLHHLVQRIAGQRPHVVLVQKNVSRLALEFLMQEKIAVARNVKASSIEHVARSTQSDIIASMDKLALEPRLGRCGTFKVQTFVHPSIMGGRKTLMRFEGCGKNLGCTLILRGGSWELLHEIKKIVGMMVLVVYGARLEGYLLRDELLLATPISPTNTGQEMALDDDKENQTPTASSIVVAPKLLERERVSKEIALSLRPYTDTALSGSPFVQYPPPYPLARLSDEDRRLTELRKLREYEETEQIMIEEAASLRELASTTSSVVSLPVMAPVLKGDTDTSSGVNSTDEQLGAATPAIAVTEASKRPTPAHDPLSVLQTPQELSRTTEIAEAEARHAERLVAWERYLMTNRDSLDPAKHQHLVVLETLGCTQTTRLCRPPTIKSITFFDQDDVSLGQYIERICRDAGKPCEAPGCGRPLLSHYETWVHGQYRITIVPEAHPVALERPELEGHIVMFAYCKMCGTRTAMTAMSPETYRLSFGEYLELSFYPQRLHRADHECDHNGHLDHVRYIMCRSITFTISMESIDLRNVAAPSRIVHIKPERQLQLRNEEYRIVLRKSTAFWDSISQRIASLNYDLVQADRVDDCRAAMAELQAKCEQDRRAIVKLLESTYEHAQLTNGTEMTGVRRALQNKAVDWEAEWTALEQRLVPTEKDVRRLTTMQLKKLFSVDDVALSPERKGTALTLSLTPLMGDLDEKLEIASEAGSEAAPSSSTPMLGESSAEASEKSAESSTVEFTSTLTKSTSAGAPPPAPSTGAAFALSPTTPVVDGRRRLSMTTDNESDSTVCADPPQMYGSNVRLPASYAVRRQTLDDTSGAESELDGQTPAAHRTRPGQNVAHLIDLFAEERPSSPSETRKEGSFKVPKSPDAIRPTIRRGLTEKPRVKGRPSSKDVLSDGDGSYARNVAVSHLSNRSAWTDTKPSRIPSARKPPPLSRTSSPTILQGQNLIEPARASRSSRPSSPQRGMFGSRLSISPTASRAPSRSGSRSGRVTPALSRTTSYEAAPLASRTSSSRPPLTTNTSHSSRSSLKGKSREAASRDDSSETGRSAKGGKSSHGGGIGVARPTTSSINKTASPSGPARRVISHGSGRHVARIRSHFDRLTRENDRERERKFGFKKARPVGNVRSTIQVFDNAVDAAKEDSDDEANQSSDGADDEDDDGDDDDEAEVDHKVVQAGSTPRASVTARTSTLMLPPPTPHIEQPVSSTSIFQELAQYDSGLPLSSMAEALVQPSLDLSAMAAAIEEVQASKRDSSPIRNGGGEGGAHKSTLSEAESTSAAPSSIVGDSFPLPRMSEGESSGTERGSIIKAISNLWAYRGADFTPLEYPLASSEHIFADNPILVREDEPSSILAFALSSKAYRGKLEEQAATASRVGDPETNLGEEMMTWKMTDVPSDIAAVEETLRKPEAKHFRLQFEDNSTTFFCKIFFAEQFDALRRNCGCSTQFIESLARCVKWESSGGRSKVDFLKTKDDRFIVKEISRLEMDALLRFAPAYFDYMSNAMATGRPTLLAKIFGFYRIGLKNPTTGKTMKLDVLVTENLFYDRKLEQVFDLKGSTRNRLVQVTKDRPHEVLMDENLVEISRRNPLYVREDSKRFLQRAIVNDSKFLAELNVMDYSLVVGVDATKQELVVGIVDFIRTYTWDKRIESWVKDSAFLGGGSNKPGGPTIITPKQYKARFCEAMDAYFLLSPDPWLNDPSLGLGGGSAKAHAQSSDATGAKDGGSA